MAKLHKILKMILVLVSLSININFSNCEEKIRGVNLGGWLMLEPWIRPSLFSQWLDAPFEKRAIDEWTFNEKLGSEEARRQLEKHWNEWVTEEDFKKIASYGLNAVRIPFSWWIIHNTEKISGLHHLDRGIKLAKKYGIKVLLDLHGAPLSQNGFDNSGMACAEHYRNKNCYAPCPEKLGWFQDSDKNYESVKKTTETLLKIAHRYKDESNILGIELLNEPWLTINLDHIKIWYKEAFSLLREIVPPNWIIVMHDSFRSSSWENFMDNKEQYPNSFIDSHIYWAFDQDIMKMNSHEILQAVCNIDSRINDLKKSNMKVIIGEWSLGHDDCAQWLDGYFEKSVKEDILKLSCTETFDNRDYQEFAKNMLYYWENTDGWFFWNFKTEKEDNWSYFKLVENGWIPNDARTFPTWVQSSQCNSMKFLK